MLTGWVICTCLILPNSAAWSQNTIIHQGETFDENTFPNPYAYLNAVDGSVNADNVFSITFDNCVFKNAKRFALVTNVTGQVTFKDCLFLDQVEDVNDTYPAIQIRDCENVLIENCEFKNTDGMISIKDCSGVIIRDCVSTTQQRDSGIEIRGLCHDVEILNNVIRGFKDGYVGGHVISTQPHDGIMFNTCLLYTSPSPRDATLSRMPSSA